MIFLLRKLYTIRYTFLSCAHSPSSQLFILSFFLACASEDKFATLRRQSFHLAVNPLGFCLLSFLQFFHHHQIHQSFALHRLKESWELGRSSNWNQHWVFASLPSFLWQAGVLSVIYGYLTNSYKYSFSSVSKGRHRFPVSYKNLYLIL